MTFYNIDEIISLLKDEIGKTKSVVEFKDPFKVLISTLISQRTKDENTYFATKKLFERYKNVEKLANAKVSEIEKIIRRSGFYKVKARRIKKISKIIIEKYHGEVPENFEELIKLPGVGRKTANCVLIYAFRKYVIPVDTHVHRVSNRIGIVKTKNPEETEKKLMEKIPKKYWKEINELMVKFGQKKCKPINPNCGGCSLSKICNYGKNKIKS